MPEPNSQMAYPDLGPACGWMYSPTVCLQSPIDGGRVRTPFWAQEALGAGRAEAKSKMSHFMSHPGTLWDIMGHYGTFWDILGHTKQHILATRPSWRFKNAVWG
jgi:hypothetical protein